MKSRQRSIENTALSEIAMAAVDCFPPLSRHSQPTIPLAAKGRQLPLSSARAGYGGPRAETGHNLPFNEQGNMPLKRLPFCPELTGSVSGVSGSI